MTESLVQPPNGFKGKVDRGPFSFFSGLACPSRTSSVVGLAERAEDEFAVQAETIIAHLGDALVGAGGIHGLARLHLYQQDKRMFPVLESARIRHEGSDPAPSSGIGVASIRDISQFRWELDGIAMSAEGFARWGARKKFDDGAAGRSASHYGQAVGIGPYAFLAGMIPIDVETGDVVHGYADVADELRFFRSGRSHTDSRRGPIIAQTASLLDRIFRLVAELGSTPADIASCTVFLARPLDYPDVIRVFREMFGPDQPSIQVVTVDEVGHKGTLIEIECTVALEGITRRVPFADSSPDTLGVITEDIVFIADQIAPDLSQDWSGQLSAALSGVDESLSELQLEPDALAALCVQIDRPLTTAPVVEAVRRHLAGREVALTVLSVSAVSQHPSANISVSAIAVPNVS